jgi:hypothetical protein
MKPLLFILFIVLLGGCANNRREAIETICKGVKSTEQTCSSAVGLTGKCEECTPSTENSESENTNQIDLSPIELQKNSMLW